MPVPAALRPTAWEAAVPLSSSGWFSGAGAHWSKNTEGIKLSGGPQVRALKGRRRPELGVPNHSRPAHRAGQPEQEMQIRMRPVEGGGARPASCRAVNEPVEAAVHLLSS